MKEMPTGKRIMAIETVLPPDLCMHDIELVDKEIQVFEINEQAPGSRRLKSRTGTYAF